MAWHIHRKREGGGTAWWPGLLLAIVSMMLMVRGNLAFAHEGHAALPSKGATVQGDELLLSAPARKAIGLETAKVSLGDLRRVVRARAQVELPWYQQAMITTLVPGRIERVLVRPGETVEAGQELVRVESLELEDLQRDLLRADAELELAERILEQSEELSRSNAVPLVDLLEARHKRDEAAAQIAIATQKLLALGLDRGTIGRVRATRQPLGMLPITSPIRGVVVHADVRTGQVVGIDEHLYHVVDTSAIAIAVEVLESDLASVRVGQPIRAEFPTLPGVRVEGTIDHIHPALDPRTRTRAAIVHIANPDHALRPGVSGRVEVEVERVEQAIVCPARALIDAPDGPVVLLRRGEGKFERRRVVLGLREGDAVEIRDGLFPGDQVIVVGAPLLAAMFHVESRAEGAPAPSPGRATDLAGGPVANAGIIEVVAQGIVELPTQAKFRIDSRIEGRLAAIRVEPGQHVEVGQVLAEIDSLALRNLQLDLLRLRLEYQWTRDAVDRLRTLAPVAAVARRQLWEREAERAVLETDLATVRSKLRAIGLPEEALQRLEEADLAATPGQRIASTVPIRSPAAGIVAPFEVVPGQVVGPSDMLFEIQDLSRIWVRGLVFEDRAAAVHVGQRARLTFPALADREVTGVIVRVAPILDRLDRADRILPLWVEVENSDGLLAEGMRAVVVMGTGDDRPAERPETPAGRRPDPPAR